ncbi:tumor susceptibility gene 101 protein-like [Anneissia japonica]|uniref:tumor susceptibility gene 101 protein-like n=1 Tax=Anneissia japonica TaxID=1529436 RepID=UPI0014259CFA|nr:tumor susceptibility gene 101 protein-like [Anneissia japonica]
MGQYDAQVRNQLSKYQHKDLAQRDVINVFASFNDLKPKIEKYAFNDGSVKDLLCIDGTIPVHYKGSRYNIPICVYVMDTHPYNPPMCFVRPTKDMLIKPSKHVDANGRIYLPYLHEWKYPNSDLIGLIQVMSVVFGEASPVYAKPPQAAPPRPQYPSGGSPHAQQNVPYPTNTGELFSYKNELHVLTATQMKLKEGQQTLERMTNDLEKEQLEVEENIKLLERKDEEVQIILNKMEGQEEIDIDEAVVATAPLYKQLLNLFAEENAIEDTMYYLSEALRKDVIETEVFLKHVRELSRRQYVVRALMQKARAKAGLTVH